MLEFENVSVGYGPTTVVQFAGFAVAREGITTLLGHNGAGKTTLLKGAVGLLKPSHGRIVLDGVEITALPAHQRIRRGLGYVPQGQRCFAELSTLENLRVVADTGRNAGARIEEQLRLFPVLREFADRQAGLLSGGQRQQLAIARALLLEPKVLLLDEPTEGIQPSVVTEIEQAILRLVSERGISVLLVEQQVGFGLCHAENFAVLESGRITQQGPGGISAMAQARAALAI
ncbi:ATP-binding cassette domain-containing protein [Granulicoccus phenolivorans]|uniref:ATP-binding cassette domain-containing protein n=1 Tax=Granulicoccus phenolivorans TaxID=266854 RepID=UPI000423B63C|nr:ATP-binding cassette domain-containing protein [Granulicoccus phenolivorans]